MRGFDFAGAADKATVYVYPDPPHNGGKRQRPPMDGYFFCAYNRRTLSSQKIRR